MDKMDQIDCIGDGGGRWKGNKGLTKQTTTITNNSVSQFLDREVGGSDKESGRNFSDSGFGEGVSAGSAVEERESGFGGAGSWGSIDVEAGVEVRAESVNAVL